MEVGYKKVVAESAFGNSKTQHSRAGIITLEGYSVESCMYNTKGI